uniref:SET domain-containing protein n=1 Tax=Arcella intermedia TaxID=1963864 RepID=A0A6B2L1E4_9EUKA
MGLISSFGKAIYESSVDIKHSEDHTKTYFFENQLDYNPRHGERYLRDRKEGLELEVIAKIIGQIHSKKESEELYQRCQELTVSKARLEANLIELKNNSTVDLTWKHKAQAAENGVQMVMEQIKYKKEALQRTQQQLSQMEETMAIIFQKYQEGRLEVYQKKKEAMKKIQEVDRKYAEQVAKRSREKTFLKVKANLLRKQIRELEARKNSKFEIAALKRSISEEEVVMGGLCEQIGRLKVELKDLIEEKKEMQEQCNELEEEQEKQHFLNTKIKTELQKNLATTREREKQLQRFVRNIEKDLEGLWFQYRPPNLQAITGGNLDLIKRDPVLHPAYRPSRNPTKEGVTDKDISKAACKTLQQFLREREVPWKIAECVLPADDPRVQLRGQHGVKAVANIRTNEVLGEYIGVLTASQTFEEENHSDSPTFHLKEKYLFGIDADVVLDSYGCGNKTLLINDGVYNTDIDRSNITYVPYQTKEEGVIRMFVMATRDIAKGEEILGAYGKDYWMNIKERDTRFQLIHAVIDKIKLLSGTNRISIRQ